jgi:hypothetical protein
MDIHSPKPVHGWREFLTEIGTIVIGVLIALAAEQVVEAFRVRHQMEEAETVIAAELAQDLASGFTHIRMADCIDHRLDDLAKVVDQAGRDGILPPVPLIGKPRSQTFTSGGWTSVVSSQVATNFSRERLAALEYRYNLIERADRLQDDEIKVWSTIYTMVGPGRAIDRRSVDDLRAAIINARSTNAQMAVIGMRLADGVNSLSLPFTERDKTNVQRVLNQPIAQLDHGHVCTSMSHEVPANYGQTS